MNTFDEIIQTKAYSDLSSNELEVIRELVSSEEEYNEMRSFYAGIDQLAISGREEVSVSVKSSLNSVFQAKHPGISQNWNAPAEAEQKIVPLYNRTLFRVAALLVLSAGVITLWVSMSDGQLMTQKESITASSDSVPLKEQKAEPKKEFPLNEERKKEFTAASTIPADETVDQSVSVKSNATTVYDLKSSTSGAASSPSPAATYKVAVSNANGSLSNFYYSTPKAPGKKSKALEAEKKEMNDGESDSFSKAGLDADLNPGGFYAGSGAAKDYKPSIKTTDLLTLIEPSF